MKRDFVGRAWRESTGDAAFGVRASGEPGRHPPLVLIHGIGMSHRYLARLHDRLARTRRVFSIDLPGFAGLPKPSRDLDVPAMAAALADVIASLRAGPVVLVGHSMGAQWAVEAALARPDAVSSVVVMGPVVDSAHASWFAQASALAVDTLGEPPTANAIVFTDYLRCGMPWYLTQARHMLAYRLDERVRELGVPLLIVRGGRDPIAGLDWCRRLRDAAPDGTLVQIPRRNHVVQHSAPRAVAAAILAHADGSG